MEKLEFQTIYGTFRPRIFRYLKRLAGKHEAEDLTQEVFIKISQALKNFRDECQLSTWIYRIAANAALDKMRSPSFRQTAQKCSLSDLTEGGEREFEDKDAWTGEKPPSVETSLSRKEMNECIRDVIEDLPASYRAVVILSELEGFKNSEIAEILGVTPDTVKIRLHRARIKLKKSLQANCSFYRDERNEFACDLKGDIK
jgi:RNA polymerase sigma-70 factor (ECF subfamily)